MKEINNTGMECSTVLYTEVTIEEGHGKTDISCLHGSRWIWWYPTPECGEWVNVVLFYNCDCGDPPKPFKKGEKQK